MRKAKQSENILLEEFLILKKLIKSYMNKRKWKAFDICLKTPYLECKPSSQVEVHSLVCHRHIHLYILAIKSFLRFYKDISVIVHDDGSLSNEDIELLKSHIKGTKIIDKKNAREKVKKALKNFPNCQKYRNKHIIAKQLFDYSLISKSDKIISLDSDILFLKRPERIIEWISNSKKETLCLYEENPTGQEILLHLGYDYQPDICAGLLCFCKDILDLKLIEEIITKMEKLDWFTTQNIYPVLIRNKADRYQASILNSDEYQSPNRLNLRFLKESKAVFRHYWSSCNVNSSYLKDFRKVINELRDY